MCRYVKNLKCKGKGDTKHNKPMPDYDQAKIYELGALLHGIIKDGPNAELTTLPVGFENTFHYLAQKLGIFVILTHFARRGAEGINTLKTTDFGTFEDPKHGKYYKLIVGSSSKNHQSDSENRDGGGLVLFKTNKFGFSPGQYLMDYMSKLNPKCQYLFPRPRR